MSTTKTFTVNKVGESIYLCRTCQRGFNSAMELCIACYTADSKNHQGHEFARLIVQRVTDMPDDYDVQVSNWWRCSFPGCNLSMCLPASPIILARLADRRSHWPCNRMVTHTCRGTALPGRCVDRSLPRDRWPALSKDLFPQKSRSRNRKSDQHEVQDLSQR